MRKEAGCLPIPFKDSDGPAVAHAPAPTPVGWRGRLVSSDDRILAGAGRPGCGGRRTLLGRFSRTRSALLTELASSSLAGAFRARLNRLMFTAFAPDDRRHVLDRFYRVLSDEAIARFYGLRLRAAIGGGSLSDARRGASRWAACLRTGAEGRRVRCCNRRRHRAYGTA